MPVKLCNQAGNAANDLFFQHAEMTLFLTSHSLFYEIELKREEIGYKYNVLHVTGVFGSSRGFTLGIILGVGVPLGNISTLKVTQW